MPVFTPGADPVWLLSVPHSRTDLGKDLKAVAVYARRYDRAARCWAIGHDWELDAREIVEARLEPCAWCPRCDRGDACTVWNRQPIWVQYLPREPRQTEVEIDPAAWEYWAQQAAVNAHNARGAARNAAEADALRAAEWERLRAEQARRAREAGYGPAQQAARGYNPFQPPSGSPGHDPHFFAGTPPTDPYARPAIDPGAIGVALRALGLAWPCTVDQVQAAFRAAALQHHPDRGGSEDAMKSAISARDVLFQALGVAR